MSDSVQVQDKRKYPFFVIDNSLIDDYGSRVGAIGVAVYCALARYTNGNGEGAYPSYSTLAKQLDLSRTTVIKTIDVLIKEGLIRKTARTTTEGDRTSNVYDLIQITHGGGTVGVPGVVQEVYQGGTGDVPDQDTVNKNQCEKECSSFNQPSLLPDDLMPSANLPGKEPQQQERIDNAKSNNTFAKSPRDGGAPREPTEQQQFFDAVCRCVGWDHNLITKEQKGQVAQTIGVFRKGGYTVSDLKEFHQRWFADDWRGKKGQFPTVSQLRAEMGKARKIQEIEYDSPQSRMRVL